MNKKVGDMEALRAAAGIHTQLKESTGTAKIRTLDIEVDLLRSFSMVLKDLKRIKNMIDNPHPEYGYGHGPGPMGRLNGEKGKVDLDRLYSISKEKLEMVEDAIDECFKKQKDSEDEDDYEDDE